jgi:hypothetical protein
MSVTNWLYGTAVAVTLSISYQAYGGEFCEMAAKAGKTSQVGYFVFVDGGVRSSKKIRHNLYNGLMTLFKGLGPFDRVIVRQADLGYSLGATVFDRCKPACPDPSWWDLLGIGKCDTPRVRKGTEEFRRNLAKRSVPLLSSNTGKPVSDLVSTLQTAANISSPGATIVLFSDLRHTDNNNTPVSSDDYDELFFKVTQGKGIPDFTGKKLIVYGHGQHKDVDKTELGNRRDFWNQIFQLGKFEKMSVGQYYQ